MTPHGLDWAVVGVAACWLLIAVFVGLRLWATRHRDPRPGFIDTGNFRYSREKDRL